MEDSNTENINLQDGLQVQEKQPDRDSNGQFVAGNKANPDGKGGFGDNPQNINTNGQPPKGWSWKEVLERIADQIAPMEVDGKAVTFREAVGNRLWLEAMSGNVAAMKELFTRMEGLPRVEVAHSGHIDTRDDKVASLLQLLYGQLHTDNSDDQGDSQNILQE